MVCSKRFFTLKSGCKSDSARPPVVSSSSRQIPHQFCAIYKSKHDLEGKNQVILSPNYEFHLGSETPAGSSCLCRHGSKDFEMRGSDE